MVLRLIGELLTNLCVLAMMPDEDRVAEFIIEIFKHVRGIETVGVYFPELAIRKGVPCGDCHNDKQDTCRNCSNLRGIDRRIYKVETPKYMFGFIVIKISDAKFFEEYEFHLTNALIIISIHLENIRYRNEIIKVNFELNRALHAAEAASQSKSVFLSNMSHELRTPLNAILGFSELLYNDVRISSEHKKTLSIINRSGSNLLKMINAVLDLAKFEAGRLTLDVEAFDLYEVVQDVVSLMTLKAKEKNLQLIVDKSDNLPQFLRADNIKLRQILTNLIANAIKFTETGMITLRVRDKKGKNLGETILKFDIEDTGIGIRSVDQARIFEPFVQLNRSAAQQGSGLGLPIISKYIELMGGKITLESRVNFGSCFSVEIPLVLAKKSEINSLENTFAKVIGLASNQDAYRILILEDQSENCLYLKKLHENIGIETRIAENGQDGVNIFREWRPHLIWMDYRMPVMDALKATACIRQLEGGMDVKIIAITASIIESESEKIFASGMDDLIVKPYKPADVFACLNRHLGVNYLYATESNHEVSDIDGFLSAEMFEKISEALIVDLYNSIVLLDLEKIDSVINEIIKVDSRLGQALKQAKNQLKFTLILRTLANCKWLKNIEKI